MSTGVSLNLDDVIDAPARALLARAGVRGDVALQALRGGANNRVYRIDDQHGNRVVLKHYFRHANDPRDRLTHEVRFAQHAQAAGVTAGPHVIESDPAAGVALFAFIDGRAPTQADVTTTGLDAMLAFVTAVNRVPRDTLPDAAEACFTMAAHHRCVLGRVQRLIAHGDPEVAAVARQRLLPVLMSCDLRDESPLPRIASPSDLGWHNALIESDGTLRLIDFEYAGVDDPAKLVCDLFQQPRFPVPRAWLERVLSVMRTFDPALDQRVQALWPVYTVKWCCILLNAFVSVDGERKRFAHTTHELGDQLRRVRERLSQLDQPWGAAA